MSIRDGGIGEGAFYKAHTHRQICKPIANAIILDCSPQRECLELPEEQTSQSAARMS
jgi:hypothetical protein